MDHHSLGSTGLRISRIGLGCNNFGDRSDRETSLSIVRRALDLGITFFDTANIYGLRGGSEDILGEAIGARRKDIVLATKFGGAMGPGPNERGGSRRHIVEAVEASLRRLRTDWIDLLQLHHPDPHTPIEETLRALNDLIRAGKVRYIGCSNLPAWQLVEAHWQASALGLEGFAVSQHEYSLLNRAVETDILPAMSACSMGLIPYYPLASGMLTGKYRGAGDPTEGRLTGGKVREPGRFLNTRNAGTVSRLAAFCERRGCSMVELALGWLAAQPSVSGIIVGASRPDQLAQNIAAVEWTPTTEDLAEIDRLTSSDADPRPAA